MAEKVAKAIETNEFVVSGPLRRLHNIIADSKEDGTQREEKFRKLRKSLDA